MQAEQEEMPDQDPAYQYAHTMALDPVAPVVVDNDSEGQKENKKDKNKNKKKKYKLRGKKLVKQLPYRSAEKCGLAFLVITIIIGITGLS